MTSSIEVDMAEPERDASGATGPDGSGRRYFRPSMTPYAKNISEAVKKFPGLDVPSDPGQDVQESSFLCFFSAFATSLSSRGKHKHAAENALSKHPAWNALSEYRLDIFGLRIPFVRPDETSNDTTHAALNFAARVSHALRAQEILSFGKFRRWGSRVFHAGEKRASCLRPNKRQH